MMLKLQNEYTVILITKPCRFTITITIIITMIMIMIMIDIMNW